MVYPAILLYIYIYAPFESCHRSTAIKHALLRCNCRYNKEQASVAVLASLWLDYCQQESRSERFPTSFPLRDEKRTSFQYRPRVRGAATEFWEEVCHIALAGWSTGSEYNPLRHTGYALEDFLHMKDWRCLDSLRVIKTLSRNCYHPLNYNY